MPIIIPYEERLIHENVFGPEGAFVLPNGEIRIVNTFPQDAYYYINNHLNEEQKYLWEKWMDKYGFSHYHPIDIFSKFLLQVCDIDMINTSRNNTVITTDPYPKIKYFNYLINNFSFYYEMPLKYDESKEYFVAYDKKHTQELEKLNNQYKREAKKIKGQVLSKDLHKYYKH